MSASSTAQRPRATRQRAAVADILTRTDEFRSAQQIHAALEAEGTKVGLATVYRALDFLMAAGLVHKVEALNAFIPCVEQDHLGHGCSAELYICGDCGNVEERHGMPRPENAPDGFKIDRSVVEYYGLCDRCAD